MNFRRLLYLYLRNLQIPIYKKKTHYTDFRPYYREYERLRLYGRTENTDVHWVDFSSS